MLIKLNIWLFPIEKNSSNIKIASAVIYKKLHFAKFLKVIFEKDLTFKSHLNNITLELDKSVNIYYKLLKYILLTIMKTLHYCNKVCTSLYCCTSIYSHLQCIQQWQWHCCCALWVPALSPGYWRCWGKQEAGQALSRICESWLLQHCTFLVPYFEIFVSYFKILYINKLMQLVLAAELHSIPY